MGKKLDAKIRGDIIKILNENKPQILEDLKKLKDTLIKTGKQILVTIKDDVVEVIVGEFISSSEEDSSDMVQYGFSDLWAKVKTAAGKLAGAVRDDVKAAIEKLKPQILEQLNQMKEIIIDAGKKVLIQVKDDVVRIIVDALKGESEIETYGFSDLWDKVKSAAKKLDSKIRGDIIKILNENKPQILEDLKKLKDTLIKTGKQILVTAKDDVVEVIVGEFISSSEEDSSDMVQYGFSDLWAKVKTAAGKLAGAIRDDVKAAIEKLKPQ